MASFNFFKRLLGDTERRERARVLARSGARMLVVDDSPTIRAVLAKMLIQDGYTVLKAADGESALEIARQEQPELIFLDIVLPGMNGFAVLRALRRDDRTRAIPIVMISGNLQATEQFYVQRFGADDFMKKPFGRAEVFSRIQNLVMSGRLPRREDTSLDNTPVVELEDMAHIPDVALPDEDLDENRLAPVSGSTINPDDVQAGQTESKTGFGHDVAPELNAHADPGEHNGHAGHLERSHQRDVAVENVSDVQQVREVAPRPEADDVTGTEQPDR